MFDHLDYVYMPSRDVAADVAWFTDVLGGRLLFAIAAMGTRVAMIELTPDPPKLVLAGHLDGDRPVLVYRVDDLDAATATLRDRGWDEGHGLEIPAGPGPVVRRNGRPSDRPLRADAAGRRGGLHRAA